MNHYKISDSLDSYQALYHYFVCYSSDGKESWQSGTEECLKVKLLNKLHKRFSGLEKFGRIGQKGQRTEANTEFIQGFTWGGRNGTFWGDPGLKGLYGHILKQPQELLGFFFNTMEPVLTNFSLFIFTKSLRQTFLQTL